MVLFRTLIIVAALAFTHTAGASGPVRARQADPVNHDDPNLVFTGDYASDTAIACPKTLKGQQLRACLVKNGLATGEEISDDAEILSDSSPRSLH